MQRWIQGDKGIWVIFLCFICISVLAIYSAVSPLAYRYRAGDTEYYLMRHTLHLLLGLGITYLVHRFNYRYWARLAPFLMAVSLLLLLYVGLQSAMLNYAKRWIWVFGISFQPSDLAKFSVVVYMAKLLTQNRQWIRDFWSGFLPLFGVIVLVFSLIAIADLSTALLVFICCVILLYMGGISLIKKEFLVFIFLSFFAITLLAMYGPRSYTGKNRFKDYIERLFNEHYEPHYQYLQANIAIVSGGILGKGPGKSEQRLYLPHPYSDFIYAIIIEEYGLVGGVFVLLLYLMLLLRCVKISVQLNDKPFGQFLVLGFALLITLQAFVHIGVNVGLLPITGLPLPFISLGGTSIVFFSMGLGIILNVSKQLMAQQ